MLLSRLCIISFLFAFCRHHHHRKKSHYFLRVFLQKYIITHNSDSIRQHKFEEKCLAYYQVVIYIENLAFQLIFFVIQNFLHIIYNKN